MGSSWAADAAQRGLDETRALAQLEESSQRCGGGLASTLILVMCMVFLFWSGILFDMIADVYGDTVGGIVVLLVSLSWVGLAYVGHRVLSKDFRLIRPPVALAAMNGATNQESIVELSGSLVSKNSELNRSLLAKNQQSFLF